MNWIVFLWGLIVLAICIGIVAVWLDARRTRKECDDLFRRYTEKRGELPPTDE